MLKQVIKNIYFLLNPLERRQGILILLVSLISVFLDAAGVASILPFMTVAANPESIHKQPLLSIASDFFGFNQTRDLLLVIGAMSLFILLLSIGFRAFATWANLRFVFMCEYSISHRLLKLYLSQPYSWFLNRHSAELSKMVLSEVNQLNQGVMTPLISLTTNLALAISMVGLAILVEPILTVVLMLVLGLTYLASYKLSNRILANIAEQRFQANQMRFQLVSETMGAVKDLKATGQEETFTRQYDLFAKQYAKKYVEAQIVAQTPRFLLESLVMGGSLIVLMYFLAGSRSLAEVVPSLSLFAFAGYRLIPALQAVFGNMVSLRFNSPSLHSLFVDFSSLSFPKPVDGGSLSEVSFHKSLELAQVSFSYPDAVQPVLRNLSLTFVTGTSTALVGATGSGKTTLVDLILGLLTPTTGKVLIDDIPLCSRTIRDWQEQVGYVSQQVFLLDDSIAANIAFGAFDQTINQDALEQAARQALIHDFIVSELPDGYQTRVGERGVRLSGGQRQRLGIARALYRNPRLLIFDESTSALDTVTEREVMKSLNRLRGSITVIMIAHRMSTVKYCDRVILLDYGTIKAQGSYDELIETCPAFQELNKLGELHPDLILPP